MTETRETYEMGNTKREGKYILWIAPIEDWEIHRTTRESTRDKNSGTSILQENWDYSGKGDPQPGDRISDHKSDETGQGWTRRGDWVIDRVESYPANIPGLQEFSEVLICTCKYDPIESEWRSNGKGIVSLDSFGGDVDAFKSWLKSDAANDPKYEIVRDF